MLQVGGLEQVAAVSSKLETKIPEWQFPGWHRAPQGTHFDGDPDLQMAAREQGVQAPVAGSKV